MRAETPDQTISVHFTQSSLNLLREADVVVVDSSFLMWRHWTPATDEFFHSSAFDRDRYEAERIRQRHASNALFRMLPQILLETECRLLVHECVKEKMAELHRKNFQASTEKGKSAEAAATTGALRLSRLLQAGLVDMVSDDGGDVAAPPLRFRNKPYLGQILSRALRTHGVDDVLQVVFFTQDRALAREVRNKQMRQEDSATPSRCTLSTMGFDYRNNVLSNWDSIDAGQRCEEDFEPGNPHPPVPFKAERPGTSLLQLFENWAFVGAVAAMIFLPFFLLPQSRTTMSPPLASFFVKSVQFDPLTGTPLLYGSRTHPEVRIRVDMGSAALHLAADMTGLSGLHWEHFQLVPDLGPVILAQLANPWEFHPGGERDAPAPSFNQAFQPLPRSPGWSLTIRSKSAE